MSFCGISLDATQTAALGSLAFAVASELIGRSKLKENSVFDVVLTTVGRYVHTTDTPKASDRKVPDVASPAPRPRGRPAKKAPSSQTAPK